MKTVPYINKGMVKDLSISKTSNEFAYENYNIRIESRGDNSLLSCTNERGNVPIDLYGETAPNKVSVMFSSVADGTKYTATVKMEHPADVPFTVVIDDFYRINVAAGDRVVTEEFDRNISSLNIKIEMQQNGGRMMLRSVRPIPEEHDQYTVRDDQPSIRDEYMEDIDVSDGGGDNGGNNVNDHASYQVPGKPMEDSFIENTDEDESDEEEEDPSEFTPYYPSSDDMPEENTGSGYQFYSSTELAPVISLSPMYIQGEYLGYCVLSEYLVIFTHEQGTDRIYRIRKNSSGKFLCRLLYKGNLGFDSAYPIETIGYYESDDIQKVYWTDGLNQPRSINIVARNIDSKSTAFDFVTTFEYGLNLTVEKLHNGSGVFPAGAVQYVATYYNKYGQETNAAFVSPLYYISDADRGNSPEETVTCSFRISADNLDTSFDYLRIYSLLYTSEHNVSAAYIVGDISLQTEGNVIIDNGTRNENIDPTKILYLGGNQISAYTFSHKDNTLFLGNIENMGEKNTEEIASWIKMNFHKEDGESVVINFEYSSVDDSIPENFSEESLYSYTNQLEYPSSQIKSFKGGEKYRFGMQFMTDTGMRSRVFWIGDKINPLYPVYDEDNHVIKRAIAKFSVPSDRFGIDNVGYNSFLNLLSDAGYTRVQLMIAEANESDRLVKAQGVISPTVFNLKERVNNQPYSAASWYMRPRGTGMASRHFDDVNQINGDYRYWYDFTSDYGTKVYIPDELRYAEIQVYDKESKPFIDNTPEIVQEHQELPEDTRNPDVIVCRLYVRRWKKDGKYKWKVYVARYHGWLVNTEYVWETQWQNNRQPVDASIVLQTGVEDTAAARFSSDYRYCWQSTEYDSPKRSYKKAFLVALREIVKLTEDEISLLDWDTVHASGGYYDDSAGSDEYRMYDVFPVQGNTYEKMSDHPNVQAAVFTNSNSSHFFVDESIITMNSPELENNLTLKTDGCNFRIVGTSKITANTVDYTMDIGMGRDNSCQKMSYSFNSIYPEDMTGLLAFPLYRDSNMADREVWRFGENAGELITQPADQHKKAVEQYYIYPWHKEGSIIGWREGYVIEPSEDTIGDTTEILAKLNSKVEATRRFAAPTDFFIKDGNYVSWSPNDFDGASDTEIKTFTEDSAQVTVMQLGSSETKLYQGNYDSLIIPSMSNGYPLYCIDGNIPIEDKEAIASAAPHSYLNSKQSVRIAYKSSPHFTIYLGKRNVLGTAYDILLPSLYEDEFTDEYENLDDIVIPWKQRLDSGSVSIGHYKQDDISDLAGATADEDAPYWFIGELYREPDTDNDFGGISDDALSKNTFVPAGNIFSLKSMSEENSDSNPALVATDGDTYYQRWDCIKTYPYAKDYTNSIVDIASIMVESHINLAGRYDRRRGMLENVTTSPTNTGMVNKAYTQEQTMFSNVSNTVVDSRKIFPNQITWTGTKVLASEIDEWTHITLANILDMDGDKGEVTAIRRFNNNLFCFQDKGIAEILFNSRVQLSTQQGVPVEIANSGKVEGKRYLTEQQGCHNKWSIIEAQSGIYFIDDLNKSINVLGQGIVNLSKEKGFDDFAKTFLTGKVWNPSAFSNVLSTYDSLFGDIYFIGKDYALCFNEGLGQFTSFYSYESTQMMTNFNNEFLSFRDKYLWKQNKGDYNVFFGKHKPYYMEYRITPEPYGDKTFTNIEYRADLWKGNTYDSKATFDVLDVRTEYQKGSERLNWRNAVPSNLQKKFRIWRAFIPRDFYDQRKLNRIRNPWMTMRLTKDTKGDTERMEFHNLLVSYIE